MAQFSVMWLNYSTIKLPLFLFNENEGRVLPHFHQPTKNEDYVDKWLGRGGDLLPDHHLA